MRLCIIVKLNHVSLFWRHSSETNTIYSLHSICWAGERKIIIQKLARLSLAFRFGWRGRELITTRSIRQILAFQQSTDQAIFKLIRLAQIALTDLTGQFCLSCLSLSEGMPGQWTSLMEFWSQPSQPLLPSLTLPHRGQTSPTMRAYGRAMCSAHQSCHSIQQLQPQQRWVSPATPGWTAERSRCSLFLSGSDIRCSP